MCTREKHPFLTLRDLERKMAVGFNSRCDTIYSCVKRVSVRGLSTLLPRSCPVGGCLFCVLIDLRDLGLKGGITISWVWVLNCVRAEKAS